jgi:ligand-binding SRPBCC domain-containing protein
VPRGGTPRPLRISGKRRAVAGGDGRAARLSRNHAGGSFGALLKLSHPWAMKLYRFEARQNLPVPIGVAWEFFSDAGNLARITPPSLGFQLTSERAGRMYAGMIITYRVRPLFGVPVSWVTEITHVDEPRLFVDEQRFGPYRFWHHQHLFREIEGGVEAHDLVHYALPPGGGVAGRLLVMPRLREIFAYRRDVLERTFGAWKD